MDRFTATGRPLRQQTDGEKAAFGFGMVAFGDVGGSAGVCPNWLPVKFTDESIIPVAVLKPEQVGKHLELKDKKKHFWQSRRASRNDEFLIKQMPRGEYLKYYAKDDAGSYIGTEHPAEDCILKGGDVAKYRRGSRTHDEIAPPSYEKATAEKPAAEMVRCTCHTSPCEHAKEG
jgi:hypothetical protein